MIIESIMNTIATILGWVVDKIPGIDLSQVDFVGSMMFLFDKAKLMNFILPIKEALVFASIIVALKLALLIFWASMRVINLIRGAG